MSQRRMILLVTAALLLAIGGYGVYRNNQATPKPTAANAVVNTGVSVFFDRPLSAAAEIRITDSSNKQVLKRTLEANAQQFNLELVPGVYAVSLVRGEQPLIESATITVTEGVLSRLDIVIPHIEELQQ